MRIEIIFVNNTASAGKYSGGFWVAPFSLPDFYLPLAFNFMYNELFRIL